MINKKIHIIRAIFSALIIFLIVYVSACNKDDTVTNTVSSPGLTGIWQFTSSPWNIVYDTTSIKGHIQHDFNFDPSVNDKVYLYESNGQIKGFTGPFEFRGTKTDSIHIDVYEPVDGRLGDDTSMVKYAQMTLTKDNFG